MEKNVASKVSLGSFFPSLLASLNPKTCTLNPKTVWSPANCRAIHRKEAVQARPA